MSILSIYIIVSSFAVSDGDSEVDEPNQAVVADAVQQGEERPVRVVEKLHGGPAATDSDTAPSSGDVSLRSKMNETRVIRSSSCAHGDSGDSQVIVGSRREAQRFMVPPQARVNPIIKITAGIYNLIYFTLIEISRES